MLFKQSEGTAARRRIPIRLVDATDGFTEETGVSLGTADLLLTKNGAAQVNAAAGATEIGTGNYYYEATAGELDTLGFLLLRAAKTGSRTFEAWCQVVPWDPYDSVRLGITALPNVAAGSAGGVPTDTDANGRVRVVDGTAAGEIDTVSGRVQITEAQVDQIVDEAWDEAIAGHLTAGSTGAALNSAGGGGAVGEHSGVYQRLRQSETVAARRRLPIRMLNSSTGAEQTGLSIATSDIRISKDGAAPAAAGGVAAVEIGSGDYYYEATAAELDTLGFLRYHVSKSGSKSFVGFAEVLSDDGAGSVADAVWDELRVDHTGGGTFGQGVASVQGNVTGSIGSLATQAKNEVNAEVDGALDTAIPGSPTADSINERIKTMDDTTLPAIKAETDNLPSAPVKNVALSNLKMYLRFSDGGLAIGLAPTAEISIDAAAFVASTNAPVIVQAGRAAYRINLTAAEMNGDSIAVRMASGTADAFVSFLTRPSP